MAITVESGTVPYYGIYNNSAKQLLPTAGISSTTLNYVAPWTVTFGGSSYYLVIEGYYVKLYHASPSTYYTLERYKASVSSSSYSFTRVYRALQPEIVFDLFNPYPYISGDSKNCSVYLKDTGSMLFVHIDYYSGNSVEVVITSTGYIQCFQSSASGNSFQTHFSNSVVTTWFDSIDNNCTNCGYASTCSYASNTRTSCYWGTTYVLESTSITPLHVQKLLLVPPASSGDYTFTIDQSSYLTGTGLVESSGELKLKVESGLCCIPMKTTHSYPDIAVSVNSQKKYIPLGVSSTYGDCSPLRVIVGGSKMSPKISRNPDYSANVFPWSGGLFDLFKENSGIKVFTAGTSESDSGGFRWFTPRIYTLPSRMYIGKVTVFGALYTEYADQHTSSNDDLPNSSYPGTYMYINTSSNNYSSWTTSNTTRYSFEAGYTGSGGARGKEVMYSFTHNGYIRQFCFVPVCAAKNNTNYTWVEFRPDKIVFVDYSSGQTYTYSV